MITTTRGQPTGEARPAFIGREAELARLNEFLARTLAGEAAVCFVTGEAGQGKSALLSRFLRRVETEHADPIVAVADCNPQTGAGDPYLPFREILGLLTGDVDTKLARGETSEESARRLGDFLRVSGRAIVEAGPDLVGVFVPGGAFLTRVAARLGRRVPWVASLQNMVEGKSGQAVELAVRDQSQIFEQYANVLKVMSRDRPLVLVLDDLHWADAGSIGLLFHLARRLSGCRILLVGAYRQDEVGAGRMGERHPLEPILQEVRRYWGDVWVDLAAAGGEDGRRIVEGLMDVEPNRFGPEFREALIARTEGHPLFAVELLRALRDAGHIRKDEDGVWVEAGPVQWGELPARVEGVIEGRIGRLEPAHVEMLRVAAVEGETFTAEIVARVLEVPERDVVRQLSGALEKAHRLVRARESRATAGGRISRYRFAHNLIQTYLYQSLDPVQRAYFHEDVARELERLHADDPAEAAVELAHHFSAAGLDDKAVEYLLIAGERAANVFANREAIQHLRRALDRLGETPLVEAGAASGSPEAPAAGPGPGMPGGAAIAARLHERLGDVLDRTGRHAEARAHFDRARLLLDPSDAYGRARTFRKRGVSLIPEQKLDAALSDLERALETLGPDRPEADAEWWEAWLATQLQRVWVLYLLNRVDDLDALTRLTEPVVERIGNAGYRATLLVARVMMDYRRDRYVLSDETLARSRKLARITTAPDFPAVASSIATGPGTGLFNLAFTHLWRREDDEAERNFDAALEHAERAGDAFLQTLCLTYRPVVGRRRGDVEPVIEDAVRARDTALVGGSHLYVAVADANLAWAARRDGRPADARELAERAMAGLSGAAAAQFPLKWMALWPLAALCMGEERWEEADHSLRAMLGPTQQPLPADLERAMRAAIAAWEGGDFDAARERQILVRDIAEPLGYA